MLDSTNCEPGDVLQICETYPDRGFVGAFMLAEKVEVWGVQGPIHVVVDRDKWNEIYIRIGWEHLQKIGSTTLVPPGFNPQS